MFRWDECLRTQRGLPKGKFATEFLRDGSLLGNEQCLSAYPSQNYRGAKRIWYSGGGLGFVAHYVRFPDHDLSIVVLGNHDTDGSWPDSVESVKKLADLYIGDQLKPKPEVVKRNHEWDKTVSAAPALSPERLSELETFAGSYCRSDNDFVELTLDRGQLQLAAITRHWQYGFRQTLQNINGNRFRSARGYDEFEISFNSKNKDDSDEKLTDPSRPTIRVQFEEGRDKVWTPVKLTSWTPKQLEALEGEYYCDELESVHRVTSTDGQLFVQYNFGRKRLHSPTTPDTFVPAAEQFCIPVRFLRDELGTAIAFSINFGRAGEVTFQKRK